MTASEAREQVGKFEFTVAISDKKPDGERRVNVLANWLLAEWEREQSSRSPKEIRLRDDQITPRPL